MTSATPTIRIRPIRSADREPLVELYGRMSADTRYARFLRATGRLSDLEATRFCGPDHQHREGLVAEVHGGAEDGRLVGHLCLDPMEDGSFEMALAVADGHRRQGIGRRLLRAAIDWAGQHEVHRLHATMLTTNTPILGLMRSMRLPVALGDPDAGVVTADITIDAALPSAVAREMAAATAKGAVS
jgi:acetyltransferase